MELTHGTGLDGQLRDGDLLSNREVACIRNLHRSAAQRNGRNLGELISEGLGNLTRGVLDGNGSGRRGSTREDVQLRAWDVVEGGHVDSEILRQDILRDVGSPVRELSDTCVSWTSAV